MIVTRLEKRHAGIFQCVASNAQGTTYGSAMLQVKPKQVTAQHGDNLPEADDSEVEGRVPAKSCGMCAKNNCICA